MDDITLPQLSLVSGMPNIACRGQRDPFVANDMNRQEQRTQTYMQRQQPAIFGCAAAAAPAGADPEVPELDVGQDNFDEEKVGELYHFKMKNVPINYQKATSVPFMDDIVDIPYSETYSIKLDSTMANNEMVPAKHYFKFPLKFAPPLPRQVIIQKYWLLKILVMWTFSPKHFFYFQRTCYDLSGEGKPTNIFCSDQDENRGRNVFLGDHIFK